MTILLPLTLLALMALTIVAVAVTRQVVLLPATVNPFAPSVSDPSADTVDGNEAMVQTVLAPQHDWQVATLSNLSQVEDLLDSLENHGVTTREVVVLTDNCFAVRWK